MINYGFEFQTPFSINSSIVMFKASETQSCQINLYLPVKVALPQINMKFSGEQDNIILDDSKLGGVALNFSRGLYIYGTSAIIFLRNHYLESLKIDLIASICRLNKLRTNYKDIYILSGIYKDVLPHDFQRNRLIVTQPDGNICLYAPQINTSLQESDCPYINDYLFNPATVDPL